MAQIMQAVTGHDPLTPQELGKVLRQHILTRAVLEVLDGRPHTLGEILELLPRKGGCSWGTAIRLSPLHTAAALTRFVALLSEARDPDDGDRPFLHVETHLWVRSVTRLLRAVGPRLRPLHRTRTRRPRRRRRPQRPVLGRPRPPLTPHRPPPRRAAAGFRDDLPEPVAHIVGTLLADDPSARPAARRRRRPRASAHARNLPPLPGYYAPTPNDPTHLYATALATLPG